MHLHYPTHQLLFFVRQHPQEVVTFLHFYKPAAVIIVMMMKVMKSFMMILPVQ